MKENNHVLTIDAGNSSIKAAWFINGNLKTVQIFNLNLLINLKNWLKNKNKYDAIISSVLKEEDTQKIITLLDNCIIVTSKTALPITLNYKTKKILGTDRICNAVYSASYSKTDYSVIIDIGTCVKFDLIGPNNSYIGGSISPGINLRYKSLHEYTGRLPLISKKSKATLIGKNTKSCIHSGVINGLQGEIKMMMEEYCMKYTNLTFFITGGDASNFDLVSKNDIFAEKNLTLIGLYEIYKHNI